MGKLKAVFFFFMCVSNQMMENSRAYKHNYWATLQVKEK